MQNRVKTLALVDWCWHGHHPTYFNGFVLALEEMGVEVLALCPNPEEAEATAKSVREQKASNQPQSTKTDFRKIRKTSRRFQNLRPARLSGIDWTIRHLMSVEKQVKEWAGESGREVDAIFYACIYDWDFYWVNYAQPFLRHSWMGLYLHAMSYRMPGQKHPYLDRVPCPEKMFKSKRCKGIGILDEGIQDQVATSLEKPVVVMPDLTDERVAISEMEKTPGGRLLNFAAGRRVIGLFGHLRISKGILTFLEAARNASESGLCFALGGDVIWPSDPDDLELMKTTLDECANIWTHLSRIPDGEDMNSLLQSCDVLYASYWNYPHSSNIMTKAALLEKPLIVSEGYLMAERVSRFHLGEVVPQGNADVLLESILKITNCPSEWVSQNKPNWAEYRRMHSFDRLKDSFAELLVSF